MYKKFVMSIAAMAALTLVSCSSDDLDSFSDNSSKNEAISFDGYLGRSAVAVNGTRGSEVKIGNLQADGFGVFGKYTTTEGQASNLFDNQKVTYSTSTTPTESKWTYSPLKFWPANGKIDFLAYAPYDKNTTLTDDYKIENFTVSKTIADQKDLLWTNDMNHKLTANLSGAKEKVKFQFHHALSRLGYTVKLPDNYSSDDVTFTLKKITLAGSSTDATKGAFYEKGTIDLSKATKDPNLWSDQTGRQYFDWFSGDYQVKSSTASHPDETNKDKDYLFVIPQNFSETIGETENQDKLYVIVEYEVTYKSGTQTSITNKVYKQLTTNFLQGKAYNLNLTIGLPIEFDVDVDVTGGVGVDGWEAPDDGTGDINIGSNDKNPWDRE